MDKRLITAFYGYTRKNRAFGGVMGFVYKLSSAAFFLIYYAGAVFLIFTDVAMLLPYTLVPLTALTASFILRRAVKRKRPCETLFLEPLWDNRRKTSFSFPSNHGTSASVIAFACLYVNTVFGAVVFLLAVLTGLSRVAAGVHYPSDILAGFILSAVCAILGFFVLPVLFL